MAKENIQIEEERTKMKKQRGRQCQKLMGQHQKLNIHATGIFKEDERIFKKIFEKKILAKNFPKLVKKLIHGTKMCSEP